VFILDWLLSARGFSSDQPFIQAHLMRAKDTIRSHEPRLGKGGKISAAGSQAKECHRPGLAHFPRRPGEKFNF
jgi:hypothetical protein